MLPQIKSKQPMGKETLAIRSDSQLDCAILNLILFSLLMKNSRFIPLISFLAAPALALGACPDEDSTLFFCNTVNDKVIEVCDLGATIQYSFGKPGSKAELVFAVPREQASTYQWMGMGPMAYTINLPNADAIYSVYWSVDRFSDDHPIDAGVNVTIKNQSVADMRCKDDDSIYNGMEGVDLPIVDE